MTTWTRHTVPSAGPVIGRVRLKNWHRVTHGVHQIDGEVGDVCRLAAWAQTLPTSGAFTHLTAARLLGLWVPPGTAELPVTAAVTGDQWRPRRAGLRVLRLDEVTTRAGPGGLPMAAPAEVILACARHLARLDLVVLVDSSLHLAVCTPDELSALSTTRRRGAKALRAALAYAEPLSESAGETLLRMVHVLGDVPVEAQHPLIDGTGRLLARADLRICNTRRLPEYDGAYHRDAAQYERDRRRDRDLQRAGWQPWSYSIHSVLRHPSSVLRDADEALGRAFDPARGRAFGEALAQSCWSAGGVSKLLGRMHNPGLAYQRLRCSSEARSGHIRQCHQPPAVVGDHSRHDLQRRKPALVADDTTTSRQVVVGHHSRAMAQPQGQWKKWRVPVR